MKKLLILLALFSINVFAEPININKADAESISQALKGVGMVRANAIVKYRRKNGSFKTLNDLTNVPGIGEQIVKKNARNLNLSGSISKKTKTKAKKTANKKAKDSKATAKKSKAKKSKAKKSKTKKSKAKKTDKKKKSKAKKTK